MKRKGLSQILWLIIAAAIMMMVALSLVFTTQSSLSDLFGSSQSSGCKRTVQSQVSTTPTYATFSLPSNCIENGKAISGLKGRENGEGRVVCVYNTTTGKTYTLMDSASSCSSSGTITPSD